MPDTATVENVTPETTAVTTQAAAASGDNGNYQGTRTLLANRLTGHFVTSEIKIEGTPALSLEIDPKSIGINGPSHGFTHGRWVNSVGSSSTTAPEALYLDFHIPHLTEMDQPAVKEQFNSVFQNLFGQISLKKQGGERVSLASCYDFSAQKPEATEENLSHKDELAKLKDKVLLGIQQAKDKGVEIPQAVTDLLEHANMFDEKNSVFGFFTSEPIPEEGHVLARLEVSKDQEENPELSNSALVAQDITARKEAIVQSIREKVLAVHKENHPAPEAAEEKAQYDQQMAQYEQDLQKLDLQLDQNNMFGESVLVRVGNKLEAADTAQNKDGKKKLVGETILADFPSATLARILNDSILFSGSSENAVKTAHLVAGTEDVKRILKEYGDENVPAFKEALENDIFLDRDERRKRDEAKEKDAENKKPALDFNFDTHVHVVRGDEKKLANDDILRIGMNLPQGVSHSQAITALEKLAIGQRASIVAEGPDARLVFGKNTAAAVESKAAGTPALA